MTNITRQSKRHTTHSKGAVIDVPEGEYGKNEIKVIKVIFLMAKNFPKLMNTNQSTLLRSSVSPNKTKKNHNSENKNKNKK